MSHPSSDAPHSPLHVTLSSSHSSGSHGSSSGGGGSLYAPTMNLFHCASDHKGGVTVLLDAEAIGMHVCAGGGAHYTELTLPHKIKSKVWYHLAITHTVGSFAAASTLSLFLDGQIVNKGGSKLNYPKVLEPITSCSFASSCPLPGDHHRGRVASMASAFRGQMGPIYFFDDALSPAQVDGIYQLGPSYMYSFLPGESGLPRDGQAAQVLSEGKEGLSTKIVLSYNAQASVGGTLFNTAPPLGEQSGGGTDGWTQGGSEARILPGVQLCARQRMQDAINCVGGVAVLFPLFTQLDQPQEGHEGERGKDKDGEENKERGNDGDTGSVEEAKGAEGEVKKVEVKENDEEAQENGSLEHQSKVTGLKKDAEGKAPVALGVGSQGLGREGSRRHERRRSEGVGSEPAGALKVVEEEEGEEAEAQVEQFRKMMQDAKKTDAKKTPSTGRANPPSSTAQARIKTASFSKSATAGRPSASSSSKPPQARQVAAASTAASGSRAGPSRPPSAPAKELRGFADEPQGAVDTQLALDIVGLLTAVLGASRAAQQHMALVHGFGVINFLLQRVAPSHLSVRLVLAVENLVCCLEGCQGE